MKTVSSSSSSGTQMTAVLSGLAAACRSTQLYEALSLPPTNHFQNGALLVSRTASQRLSQSSRSAYSVKQSGNLSSVNRSKIAGSLAFACCTNAGGGGKYSSSRQWTAIWDSETCCVSSVSDIPVLQAVGHPRAALRAARQGLVLLGCPCWHNWLAGTP